MERLRLVLSNLIHRFNERRVARRFKGDGMRVAHLLHWHNRVKQAE